MTFSYLLFGRLGAIGIAGVLFGFAGLTNVYAAAAAAGKPPAAAKSAAAAPGGPGADVCKGCHESYVDNYSKSIHGQKGHRNSPANAGECASCHGDATKHVEAGGGKGVGVRGFSGKGNAQAKSAACLTCHEGNRNLAFWSAGQHKKQDVSCDNCHSIHAGRTAGNDKMLKVSNPSVSGYTSTVRQLQHESCNNCHKSIRTQINKPSHHPIIEGKVKCSDCHNPHGALSKAMIKAESINDLCLTCHTDKRGPWIHEHPPVEENCLVCHTPHGSRHNRLLAQKTPQLCGDCHANGHTHGIYDGRGRLPGVLPGNVRFIATGCINCHRQIHGGNAPSAGRGEVFVR